MRARPAAIFVGNFRAFRALRRAAGPTQSHSAHADAPQWRCADETGRKGYAGWSALYRFRPSPRAQRGPGARRPIPAAVQSMAPQEPPACAANLRSQSAVPVTGRALSKTAVPWEVEKPAHGPLTCERQAVCRCLPSALPASRPSLG
jgi:hypothetical protein